MGIRVTKVVGYGLTDVKTRKHSIADSRINKKSPLLKWEAKETLDDYLDWIMENHDPDDYSHFNMDRYLDHERKTPDFDWYKKTGARCPNDLVHWGSEYMEKNVLLIRPLSMKDWRRYDDAIDYIEETMRNDDAINWYREVPGGIFPYNGIFMNAHTGERVKDGVEYWRYLTWPRFQNIIAPDKLDALLQQAGFADAEDARVNMVPSVPDCVKDLCKWGKLFTDDDVWKQLRPLIYTYWS